MIYSWNMKEHTSKSRHKSLSSKSSKRMCYRVDCKTCGKHSWGGCGEHLTTLYASIEQGKHCMCRSWPGVVIPSQSQIQTQPTATAEPSGNIPRGNENPTTLEAASGAGLQ